MRKLYEMKTVAKDGHHLFTYKDGKKTPIPDDGVVYLYLSKSRMLKATEYPDVAGSIDGKFICTDEVTSIKGTPAVDGRKYDIWGAGEDYVYLSKDCNEPYHTRDFVSDKKVVVYSPSNPVKKADLELLRQFYMMLK